MFGDDNPVSTPETTSAPEAADMPVAAPEAQPVADPPPAESPEIAEMMAGMGDLPATLLAPGQVVKGTVLKVTDSEVIVDIGLKSEAPIARSEFTSGDGTINIKTGDVVDVWIDDYNEEEGTATVSHQKAARVRAWDDAEGAYHAQTNVRGRVVERTKGGLTVDVAGVRAFLPASQADLRPLRNLDSLIGQEIECKVIKLNKARNNAVVSRRAVLEEEANLRKAQLLAQLEEGRDLVGRVKNLTDYGAFVDLGGMDGLLHVTDLSWGRVAHPSEVIKVGQEIRVKVLKFDREKERISLGLKQLAPDPWEHVLTTYHPGERVFGRVVSLTDYGAFVELEPGVEGLIHVSEMTWSKRLKHPSKILNVGDRVEVAILDANPAQRRISLSLKQTLPDPWTTLADRLSVGATIHGRVRNLTDFGAFVEIEDGVDGLIHVSDLSWTKNVKHPSDLLKKGQEVDTVVLAIDAAHRRISLGMKQLQPDIWQQFFARTPVGAVVHGKVVRMAQFGAFVEIEEGIDGLCHVSEFTEEHTRTNPVVKVGNELEFRVLRVNPSEKKIGLSLKGVAEAREAADRPQDQPERVASVAVPAPVQTEMARKMAEAMRAATLPPALIADAPPVAPQPQPVPAENGENGGLRMPVASVPPATDAPQVVADPAIASEAES